MYPEVLLLGGGWRKGGIGCWRAEPVEYGKTVERQSYDEREWKWESVVESVHTWSAAMSFASGAWAMLHAPARVARSSRSTGAVWAMMMMVVGCCWMGMGGMGEVRMFQDGEGDRSVAGLFVVVGWSNTFYLLLLLTGYVLSDRNKINS